MITQIKKSLKEIYFRSYPNSTISRIRTALEAFEAEYRDIRKSVHERVISNLTPSLTVLSGPFRGMRYPNLEAAGSVLVPKLIGTYEMELRPCIEEIVGNNYPIMLNIGSSEGYYAVGLALRCPHTSIMAFDIDPVARRLLSEMAKSNSVSDRISVEGLCDTRSLETAASEERGIIISDCEGCELDLFSPSAIAGLKSFDFLIETHDSLSVNITRTLIDRFQKTHRTRLIKGRKRTVKDFPPSSVFTPTEKLLAMHEGRHRKPKWLFMESLRNTGRESFRSF